MQELYGNVPASELTDLMRVEPKPFLSLLLNPFGTHARGIEHRNLQLIIDARRGRKVHLKNLTAPPTVTKGLLWTTVRIEMDDGSGVALRGVNHRPANVFAQEVQEAWSAFNIELFEEKRSEIDAILRAIDGLDLPTRYPAACVLSPVLDAGRTLEKTLFAKLRSEAIGEAHFAQIRKIREFINAPGPRRNQAIE